MERSRYAVVRSVWYISSAKTKNISCRCKRHLVETTTESKKNTIAKQQPEKMRQSPFTLKRSKDEVNWIKKQEAECVCVRASVRSLRL